MWPRAGLVVGSGSQLSGSSSENIRGVISFDGEVRSRLNVLTVSSPLGPWLVDSEEGKTGTDLSVHCAAPQVLWVGF